MDTKYFASPDLSKLLQDRGVVSQFDYWWCKKHIAHGGSGKLELQEGQPSHADDVQQAYNWADLCLPENAWKIWPGTYYGDTGPEPEFINKTSWLLFHVQQPNSRWHSWLLSELTKQEGK